MKTTTNETPVSIRSAVTGQFMAVKRGDRFPDDHELVTDHPWLFAEADSEDPEASSGRPVEDGSARPGARRGGPIRGERR
jgi:hypothetical protein